MALYSIICVCSNFTDKLQILTIVLLIIGSYLMVSTLKLKRFKKKRYMRFF